MALVGFGFLSEIFRGGAGHEDGAGFIGRVVARGRPGEGRFWERSGSVGNGCSEPVIVEFSGAEGAYFSVHAVLRVQHDFLKGAPATVLLIQALEERDVEL